jgi:hypothetical protein
MEKSAIIEIRREQVPLSTGAHIPSAPNPCRQECTDFLIPSSTILQIVGEECLQYRAQVYFEPDAILAIQTAAEDFIVEIFQVRICSCISMPSHVLVQRV